MQRLLLESESPLGCNPPLIPNNFKPLSSLKTKLHTTTTNPTPLYNLHDNPISLTSMAYLKNFKKLLTPKKVLRLFTTKLRLHKLQRPSKSSSPKIKKRPTSWLSLTFQSRFKRKRKDICRYPRKKTKPVYVDQLFLERKQAELPVVERAVEGSKGGGGAADEMWESLVMGSSQMEGINERAEEFISRFRADLLVQEIRARRL